MAKKKRNPPRKSVLDLDQDSRSLQTIVCQIIKDRGWALVGLMFPYPSKTDGKIPETKTHFLDQKVGLRRRGKYRLFQQDDLFDLVRWEVAEILSRFSILGYFLWQLAGELRPKPLEVLETLDPINWPGMDLSEPSRYDQRWLERWLGRTVGPGEDFDLLGVLPRPTRRASCLVRVHVDLALPLEEQFLETQIILKKLQPETFKLAGFRATRAKRSIEGVPYSEVQFLVFALRYYAQFSEAFTAHFLDIVAPPPNAKGKLLVSPEGHYIGGGEDRVHKAYLDATRRLRKAKLLDRLSPGRPRSSPSKRKKFAPPLQHYLAHHHPDDCPGFQKAHQKELL